MSLLLKPKSAFLVILALTSLLLLFNLSIRFYRSYVEVDCPLPSSVVTSSGADSHEEVEDNLKTPKLEDKKLCCPKVYLYDPRDVLRRAQQIRGKPLKLEHLDPLNFASTFEDTPYKGNVSIPPESRVEVLTKLLRWVPGGYSNQSLLIPLRSPHARIWYSKDFLNIFNFRLALSSCITRDPSEAELFFVPMSVHTDHSHGRKESESDEWNALFASLTNYQFLFEHFTAATASKHVIFSGSFGHSRKSIGLWHPPFPDPRVASMQRVALGSECLISHSYQALRYLVKSAPNVHSAPFTSLMPYPENYFDESLEKPLLVSAFFGFHGRDSIKKLRQKLIRICESSDKCSTRSLKSKISTLDRKEGLLGIFESKRRSVFCLEPEGDWPTRQSMIQDLMLNCIPVFFSHNHLRLWPAFWGNFIDSVSVTFDYRKVMSGKIKVIDSLASISPAIIAKKQKIMAMHKHQLLFLHMNTYMEEGNNVKHECSVDAANLLLHDLRAASV